MKKTTKKTIRPIAAPAASSLNCTRFACLPDGADNALFRVMLAAVVQIHAWRECSEADRRALRTWASRTLRARCTPDEYLAATIIANQLDLPAGLPLTQEARP